MATKSIFSSLLLAVVCAVPLLGQVPTEKKSGPQGNDRGDSQAAAQNELARELTALKESVKRLEAKLDKLAELPSEFSRVSVRVVDEQMKPVSEFWVQLSSSDEAQRAIASGTTNKEGLAFTRHLPYGKYGISIQGQGWHAYHSNATVEVGTALDLTVVAPSLDSFGQVSLESVLDEDNLKGLFFGEYAVQSDNDNWHSYVPPEPGERMQERWRGFPTVGDGIDVIALIATIDIERHVRQPDGRDQVWKWIQNMDQPPYRQWLVRSDGKWNPVLKTTTAHIAVKQQADRFHSLIEAAGDENQPQNEEQRALGYVKLKLGDERSSPATIQLPTGELTLRFGHIYGRPTAEVLDVIDGRDESPSEEIWLSASVSANSKWFDRLVGESVPKARQLPFQRAIQAKSEVTEDKPSTVKIGKES